MPTTVAFGGVPAFEYLDVAIRIFLLQLLRVERRLLDPGVLDLAHQARRLRPELLGGIIDDQPADDDAQGHSEQKDGDARDEEG
ncbi:hypothetical protein ACFSTC_49705 [Nonomuraea ferruginea]